MRGFIKKRGKRSWAVILDVRDEMGRRKRKWHSVKGNRKDAEAAQAKLINDINTANYVAPSKLTVEQHTRNRLAQWEASGRIGAKTAERYRELIHNQINPHIGHRLVQKLKAADIEAWHSALATRGRKDGTGGVSARTIRHAHRLLSTALKEAARHDLVQRNVAAIERTPKVIEEEVTIIGEHQLAELLDKLKGRAIYPKIMVALFCGLRRGELLALRWRAIDLDAKVLQVREALEQTRAHGIRIKQPKTKSGRREVTLPDIVADVLRAHRREQLEVRLRLGLGKPSDDDLVFPNFEGDLLSPGAFTNEWTEIANSIGLSGVTLHALRHTHASMLIAGGLDVVTVSKRLGHASPNVTLRVYAHLFRQRDDKAAEAINTALANLGRK